MNKWQSASELLRHLGPRWCAFRAWYALKLRSGYFSRRWPVCRWEDKPLTCYLRNPALADAERYLEHRRSEAAPAFFFKTADRPAYSGVLQAMDAASWTTGRTGHTAEEERSSAIEEAERLVRGEYPYFSHRWVNMGGGMPDWHRNAFTGEVAPADVHWSRMGDFGYGDIKVLWEPARFGFAYTLVRAYWRTGEERFVEAFWRLVESWHQANPPHAGVHWKCGQEISFRVMAWCFGLFGFLDARATTAERVSLLAQMIAASGERIEANLSYALSQSNNHGISEGLGLWTIGLLFPEFVAASRWKVRGQQVLEKLGGELIYSDGAFAQHSANYHRLMLHDYLWAVRLGELNGVSLSEPLRQRVALAGEFLWQIQDEHSGGVPLYGSNDGALILPLNGCDYLDFRPVVQALSYLHEGTRKLASGPWDEDLVWLFGPDALQSTIQEKARTDFSAPEGGCSTMRGEDSFVFIRCGKFRHRPADADLLHVDLWGKGINITQDPGTFSYNAPPPWDAPLKRTVHHNTVTVDGLDQMEKFGKFLWLPWATGRISSHRLSSANRYWEGEHDGYRRLPNPVSYRRAVMGLAGDTWVIVDSLQSLGVHDYRLQWLLPEECTREDREHVAIDAHDGRTVARMHIATLGEAAEVSLVSAAPGDARGWISPRYGQKKPAVSLHADVRAEKIIFVTIVSPKQFTFTALNARIELDLDGVHYALATSEDATKPLLSMVASEKAEMQETQVRIKHRSRPANITAN